MKMRTFIKTALICLVTLFVVGAGLVVGGVIPAFALFGGGVTFASIAPIINTVTTVEGIKAVSTLDLNTISKKIVEMRPTATPLDTIMRKSQSEKIESFVYEYYKVDTKAVSDVVLTGYTKSTDGDVTGIIVPTSTDMWSVDDTIWIPSIAGIDGAGLGVNQKGIMLCVTAINRSTNQVSFQAINGNLGTVAMAAIRICPTIPASTVIYRLGKAGAELDMQTTPYAMIPIKATNNCQIFMAQVEESTYQAMHRQEVDWGFSDYEALNIYDMKETMEASMLFGYGYKFKDVQDNQTKYTTQGIIRSLTGVATYGTGAADRSITKVQYVNWMKQAFCGNSGSDKRLFFYGATIGASLQQLTDYEKHLQSTDTEIVWGITFKKLVTNFGTLLAMYHPLFTQYGYDDYGIILDINNVTKFEFQSLKFEELDLRGSGQRNSKATFITEAAGLALKYENTHLFIKPTP